ncbi:MAG: cell division protein FtsZ [Rhizobiaceae bacterium]|nr:cell division protein FtsZ [Hyphomicrobiales bacterium]NRB31493.1 cell division protein FtsZ [Rhizobiaceae bacterium]
MTLNLHKPDITELKPRITVFGVGGGGGNAVNNMISSGLDGVDFVVANTDAQALTMSKAERLIQMGVAVTEGLGAGSQPEVGAAAAQECIDEINDHLSGTHMAFVTAGMGGGTGTGAAPVVAKAARDAGILTVGVVTKPFSFEGKRRMALAEEGIQELQKNVDTLIVIPNQNLFRVANDKTTFADAFSMADQVLYSGVACITDLMVKEGLINLDFADVRSVMREMGRAMMGTGEASGEGRAMAAAEAAISNPLLDETSMAGSQGLLISITGGRDMTLFEVDEAATRIREEVDPDANIILGATFDESLEGVIRVSVVATGIDSEVSAAAAPNTQLMNDAAERLRLSALARSEAQNEAATASKAEETAGRVEEDLTIPAAPALEIERSPVTTPSAVPFEAENADFVDPISDDEFQSALEEQLAIPAEPAPEPAPRMPAVEDFPAVAQQKMAAQPRPAGEENGPMGLLKRLATGLGGTHAPEEQAAPPAPAATAPSAAPTMPSPAPAAREDNNPYAPPKNGTLDVHGRAAPAAKPISEDDQLDIPAFLRRQA